VLVGFDLLGAADPATLGVVRPGHTVAVVNTSLSPTAAMVTGRVVLPGSPDDALDAIRAATGEVHPVDAQRLSEALFGDHMPANVLLLGAAWQHGVVPVSAEALEQAIRLNGAAVETTLAAFRWGRAAAIDPDAVLAVLVPPAPPVVAVDARSAALAGELEGLEDVLAARIADLAGYQDEAYARRYAEEVRRVSALANEAWVPTTGRGSPARTPAACTRSWPTRTSTRSRGCTSTRWRSPTARPSTAPTPTSR
jgi:indolepyruvate ferredoxin oxidoreductase